MANHLQAINKLQRVDMIEMGLNPLNPDHVAKYLKGGPVKAQVQENIDRMKAVMGPLLNANLGHATHNDSDPRAGQEFTPGNIPTQAPRTPQDFRNQIAGEMDEYAQRSGGNMGTGNLMNIREARPHQSPTGAGQLNEVVSAAKTLATNYHNAYVKSLQNPSTASNMAVYKALKAMLEQEQKLKESKALPTFQKAVHTITQQMYNQLKG